MRYNPSLDGIRALAVLAVLCLHCGAPFAKGGFIGVDAFFVLSGFLITQSLQERPGLLAFYERRIRRLMPALVLMLLVYVSAAPLIYPGWNHLRDALLALLYLSDYTYAFASLPKYLPHTWSLSVEEHFYLLWPLIFTRFRPGRVALIVGFIAATAWRFSWGDWQEAYFRFDTRMSGLILGCLLASIPRWKFPAWPGLLLLLGLTLALTSGSTVAKNQGILLAEVGAAVAIMGTPPRWLGAAPLAYVGRISYGVYLWHYPIARSLRDLEWPVALSITLVLSLGLAALSYHTIEAAFRRRSRKLVDLDVASDG